MSDTSMTASSIFVQTDEKLGNHQQFDGTAMSIVSVAVFFFQFTGMILYKTVDE